LVSWKDVDEVYASLVLAREPQGTLKGGFVTPVAIQWDEKMVRPWCRGARARRELKHVASGPCQNSLGDTTTEPAAGVDAAVCGEEYHIALLLIGCEGEGVRYVLGIRPPQHAGRGVADAA
jgi:hypothetical protein